MEDYFEIVVDFEQFEILINRRKLDEFLRWRIQPCHGCDWLPTRWLFWVFMSGTWSISKSLFYIIIVGETYLTIVDYQILDFVVEGLNK